MISDIIKLIEDGKVEEVLKKLDEIKGDANLEIVALKLIERGYLKEAEEVANRIRVLGLRDEVLRKLAIAYVEKGDVEKALELAKNIKTESDLEKIALALIEKDKFREALKVIELIKSKAIKEELLLKIINILLEKLNL